MATRKIEDLNREAIGRRTRTQAAYRAVRQRLTPEGLKAEAVMQARRAGHSFAATPAGRWIETAILAVALLSVGISVIGGVRPPGGAKRRTACGWASHSSPLHQPTESFHHGDQHEDDEAFDRPTKTQGRGRSRQVQAKSTEGVGRGKRAGRRANGNGNGHSGSYLRSAERLAGRMKSALAEYASLAGDSPAGRRKLRPGTAQHPRLRTG